MRKAFLYIFLFLFGQMVHAQDGKTFLEPLQERDSILVADQVLYGFELKQVEEGTMLVLPQWENDEQQSGVEVVSPWLIDTLKVKKQKKGMPRLLDIRYGMVLTSFDEGLYELPPVSVQRVSPAGIVDTLVFEPSVMDVKTIQIDTASFQPHDIKAQMRYPLTVDEVVPWVGLYWVVAVLVILAVCLYNIRKRRSDPEYARTDPAHIVALRELDKYRGSKMWAPEKQKQFYSGVTDALREYISSRYGIAAMEMTTNEIFNDMKGTDVPQKLQEEVRDLFVLADFVKFAKHVASEEDNSAVLPVAVRFVTETYRIEVDDENSGTDAPDKGGNE